MANWKKRKGAKASRRPKQVRPVTMLSSLPHQRRVVTFARASYALVFALFSWISIVVIFVPRINITPTQAFDPKTPFSSWFEIQNNGQFAAYDVHLSDEVNGRIGAAGFGKGINNMYSNCPACEFGMEPPLITKIEPGRKPASWLNVMLENVPTRKGDRLEVTISATYRPAFTWWHNKVTQRFNTVRSPDGSFNWVEAEVDK